MSVDIEPVNSILPKKPLLRGTEVLEQVKKLEMSLSRFDFEGAWDFLVAIAQTLDCPLDKD